MERPVGLFSALCSRRAPAQELFVRLVRRSIYIHPVILRPEGLDALGHIAIVDVAAINLEKVG